MTATHDVNPTIPTTPALPLAGAGPEDLEAGVHRRPRPAARSGRSRPATPRPSWPRSGPLTEDGEPGNPAEGLEAIVSVNFI